MRIYKLPQKASVFFSTRTEKAYIIHRGFDFLTHLDAKGYNMCIMFHNMK